jgi:hypothetical protein
LNGVNKKHLIYWQSSRPEIGLTAAFDCHPDAFLPRMRNYWDGRDTLPMDGKSRSCGLVIAPTTIAITSRADAALCSLLAYYTDGDHARVDRLFRLSGLYRPKWDRPTAGSTYGAITIEASMKNAFRPNDGNEEAPIDVT